MGGGGVCPAARRAVRRLSVIRANDGGRALHGTMRGAEGFCRPEWLIGLPGGSEGGAVSRGGVGGGRKGHCPRVSRGADARPSVARPSPGPGAAAGKAAAGRPPGGLLGNGGQKGVRVGPLAGAAATEKVGPELCSPEETQSGPAVPGKVSFSSRSRIATQVTTPHTHLFRPAPWELADVEASSQSYC